MKKEFKFRSLAEFKADSTSADADNGILEGYASRFSEVDDGFTEEKTGRSIADMVMPGAFSDALAEFLETGFNAKSHDWSVDGLIGFPVEAKEDGIGLFLKFQFHSTPDAQIVRTKCQERMAAGKSVGLSIGWQATKAPIMIAKKNLAAEMPKYVADTQKCAAAVAKGQGYDFVRLLPGIKLFETSIVTSPMLPTAGATSVKSAQTKAFTAPNIKGMFEDELKDRTNSTWFLFDVFMSALWAIDCAEDMAEMSGMTYDAIGASVEAVDEFAVRLRDAMAVRFGPDEDAADEMAAEIELSGLLAAPDGKSPVGFTFTKHAEVVLAATDAFVKRARSLVELRTKESRKISTDRLNTLSDIESRGRAVVDDLKALIDEATPGAKGADAGHQEANNNVTEVQQKAHAGYMRLLADSHQLSR